MSDLSSAAEEEAARIARELPWTASQVLFFGIRARAIGCLDVEAFLGRCNERGIFPDAALQHLEELDDLSWPGPRRPFDRGGASFGRSFDLTRRPGPSVAWVAWASVCAIALAASAVHLLESGTGDAMDFVGIALLLAACGVILYHELLGRW